MKGKVRVLLCDDQTLFREGIKAILKDELSIEIVGEADNGRQAVALALQLQPDIVLMDIAMPDLSGFEATYRILQAKMKIKTLVIGYVFALALFLFAQHRDGISQSSGFTGVVDLTHTSSGRTNSRVPQQISGPVRNATLVQKDFPRRVAASGCLDFLRDDLL